MTELERSAERACPTNQGRGSVRVDPGTLVTLNLNAGDVVEIDDTSSNQRAWPRPDANRRAAELIEHQAGSADWSEHEATGSLSWGIRR